MAKPSILQTLCVRSAVSPSTEALHPSRRLGRYSQSHRILAPMAAHESGEKLKRVVDFGVDPNSLKSQAGVKGGQRRRAFGVGS
jgi:hypothetical protein